MKIAIVHDWLTGMGGAERLIINFKEIYKDAPIYTTFYNPEKLAKELKDLDVRTSFLQGKKMVTNHKKYFPFMPLAFALFNLKEYDVVLSSSTCCAKGVKVPNGVHICYCNTPMRYAWEKKDEYLKNMNPVKKLLVNVFLWFMRKWDVWSSKRVDYFIANSTAVQERIKKYYNRDSIVINPAVRCKMFNISNVNGDYYFIVSRLVSYKRFDLAVKACSELGKKLIVIGDGPEKQNLEKIANENVTFLGQQPDEVVQKYMSECKALLFPGEEDFGITPVEAMSCGRPVIAYGKGGVLDTVIDGETGLLFNEQTSKAVEQAIKKFETMQFDKQKIHEHALKFDEEIFKEKIKKYIEEVSEKNENSSRC